MNMHKGLLVKNWRCSTILAAIPFLVLAQVAPTTAVAQGADSAERQKAHIVSRMYQATYGAQERCRVSKDASADLAEAVGRFRRAYPNLVNLVERSPYLPQAKAKFKAFLNGDTNPDDDMLKQECQTMALMLREIVETPDGQQAAKQMLETLTQ